MRVHFNTAGLLTPLRNIFYIVNNSFFTIVL